MEKIIVYINDAEHALTLLAPMKCQSAGPAAGALGTQWLLVACPPRMTRHVSKWVAGSARKNWRDKWCAQMFAKVSPWLETKGDQVIPLVAREPLVQMTANLLARHGSARVLDARQVHLGQILPPVTQDQPAETGNRWALPGALIGMGTVMALAAE